MRKYVREAFKELGEKDTYSLLLFLLYNLKVIPGYRNLVELMYIINKNNLLKLCQYYGGKTITFPTIEELQRVLNVLKMYQFIDVEGADKETILSNYTEDEINDYNLLRDVISGYEFESNRESTE